MRSSDHLRLVQGITRCECCGGDRVFETPSDWPFTSLDPPAEDDSGSYWCLDCDDLDEDLERPAWFDVLGGLSATERAALWDWARVYRGERASLEAAFDREGSYCIEIGQFHVRWGGPTIARSPVTGSIDVELGRRRQLGFVPDEGWVQRVCPLPRLANAVIEALLRDPELMLFDADDEHIDAALAPAPPGPVQTIAVPQLAEAITDGLLQRGRVRLIDLGVFERRKVRTNELISGHQSEESAFTVVFLPDELLVRMQPDR